jgi:hypothetical protein
MLKAVQAVQAKIRDSKTRIFIETPLTFFSELDEWLYIEISDTRLCRTCEANAAMENGVYRGNSLRTFFPFLEIQDENTIKVNEHPNCRCVLVRIAKAEALFKQIIFKEKHEE